MAGVGEAALDHGVVLGEVAECKSVADCGRNHGRVEGELGVGTDGNGVVGCKSEGEQSQEGDGGCGMHLTVG